jgi:hypothetical protein
VNAPAPPSPPTSSRWTTPRRLRAFVAAAAVASGLLFLVGLQSLNANRATLRAISGQTAPAIVSAQDLGAQLAALDTELVDSVLGTTADRDVANELFELRRSAASRLLVDASNQLSQGDADRIPVVVMNEELGRYLELAARAQWLYAAGDRDGALAALGLATNLMHARVLPAAAALDAVTRERMDRQYDAAVMASFRYEAEASGAGLLLLVVLVMAQVYVRRRMRRRFVPALLAATVLALAFSGYLIGRFRVARENLRAARDDAFNSVHLLWRARAIAYDAKGDESRWLLDRTRKAELQASYEARMTQLLSKPGNYHVDSVEIGPSGKVTGLLVDELHNVTFQGEKEAAEGAVAELTTVSGLDERIRRLENQGKHAEAVELCIGFRDDGARAAFDRFDATLQRTLAINQAAFEEVTAASDRTLRRAEIIDPVLALAVALFAWLGIRPRLREYA